LQEKDDECAHPKPVIFYFTQKGSIIPEFIKAWIRLPYCRMAGVVWRIFNDGLFHLTGPKQQELISLA
jgi:hypothetical protein